MLLAMGMGAGVAAIFRAPLAGALFAAEVLYARTDFESEEWAEERVTQTREGGVLRREFTRTDSGAVPGRVTIEYPDPDAGEPTPGVAIRNPWCGYDALIVPVQTPSTRAR